MPLFEELTPEQHFKFITDLNEEKTEDLNNLRSLIPSEDLKTKVKLLSSSSRQLTSVLMALICDAKIIMLDEPCTGLDKNTK
jgi:NitT/TauT family transport system ATP-binding protein